jgi:hypothetical protein
VYIEGMHASGVPKLQTRVADSKAEGKLSSFVDLTPKWKRILVSVFKIENALYQ